MRLSEFQKANIRKNNPVYQVIFEDMAKAGILDKDLVELLLSRGPEACLTAPTETLEESE